MSDTIYNAVDRNGAAIGFKALVDAVTGALSLYHAEDPTQRAALLAALAPLATAAQVGEVQASPTANTVLDRLKALNTTVQAVLSAIQQPRAETLWTDDTGAYFVRIDNGGSISWTDVSGNTAAAPGTGSRPAAGTTAIVDRATYQATTTGTGFSTGDLLDHFVISDPLTGTAIGHWWINGTTELKLSVAPASNAITPLAVLPTGAATSANQGTANTALQAIQTAITATLATQPKYAASGVAAVLTDFSGTGQSASFTPVAGRPFNISGWGTLTGSIQLERSFDAGSNWLPLTAAGTALAKWTAAFSEQWVETEVGVIYRLNCTAQSAGPLHTRISQ